MTKVFCGNITEKNANGSHILELLANPLCGFWAPTTRSWWEVVYAKNEGFTMKISATIKAFEWQGRMAYFFAEEM